VGRGSFGYYALFAKATDENEYVLKIEMRQDKMYLKWEACMHVGNCK